jgi:hypothetical protein
MIVVFLIAALAAVLIAGLEYITTTSDPNDEPRHEVDRGKA